MRHYNADPTHRIQLQFYGFDSPTEMMGSDSPRQVLHFALDYLASIDEALGQEYRSRIDPLLGPDAAWENPAAMMDPAQSIGLEPAATALRIETEELIADLQVRRPELVAKSDERRYLEAAQYASVARQLLNYHAALARESVADAIEFMEPSSSVQMLMVDGRPAGVQLPASVELTVSETEPGVRGDTVSNVNKPATLETGATVQVPLFVNTGDRIKVDPRERRYISRA